MSGVTTSTRTWPHTSRLGSLHASYAIGYWGPIEIPLGVLARVLGDTHGALAHHKSAAEAIDACCAARARALNNYQWALAIWVSPRIVEA